MTKKINLKITKIINQKIVIEKETEKIEIIIIKTFLMKPKTMRNKTLKI